MFGISNLGKPGEMTFTCWRCTKVITSNHSCVHPTELMGNFCDDCYAELEREAIAEGKRIRGLDELNNPWLAIIRIEAYEKYGICKLREDV